MLAQASAMMATLRAHADGHADDHAVRAGAGHDLDALNTGIEWRLPKLGMELRRHVAAQEFTGRLGAAAQP